MSRSEWASLLASEPLNWMLGGRIAVALALLYPLESRMAHLLSACPSDAMVCPAASTPIQILLTFLELLCASSFAAGAFTRVFAFPAMVLLAVKAVSDLAASANAELSATIDRFVHPSGDWAFAAMHLGALSLAWDLRRVGSGRWSVDRWLFSRWFV